jgi:uncharacterized protein (DUF1015 family)
VAAVPYDVVDVAEARALADREPLSFLHVSRPEIDLPAGTDAHSDEVYARAVTNMAALTKAAPLVMEESGSIYLYRLRMDAHVQTGVAACFDVDEYERDLIRKHERTRKDKEDDRTRHILSLRAQTGPAFLLYRSLASVRAITERVMRDGRPLFEFVAVDGVEHTIWRAGSDDRDALVAAFASVPALYIADGHHRAAAAARARGELRSRHRVAGEWDRFLAVAFPDDEVQILPYNRIVRDLAGHTPRSLLDALRERVVVGEGRAIPAGRGEVAMFLDGRWHALELGAAPAGTPAEAALDVSRLQETILAPLLGIRDVTTDTRIDFVGGIRGPGALESRVKSGSAAVAFSMHPVSVSDIMAISDAGGIMPPKSTWFEPKLRDGLLSHVIDS